MKTNIFIFFAVTLIFTACDKNDSNPTTNPVTSESYINTNAGSTWNYQQNDSSGTTPLRSDYTVTSTSRDSTINGRKYHVYNYSYGGNQYLGVSGHDYYQYDSIPVSGGIYVERLYLKNNLDEGKTWEQNFDLTIPSVGFPVTLVATNKIVEKGISRTVNGHDYTNVTHVTTSLSSELIPVTAFTSAIESYYARDYGLIESSVLVQLNYGALSEKVNTKTQLMSATLK